MTNFQRFLISSELFTLRRKIFRKNPMDLSCQTFGRLMPDNLFTPVRMNSNIYQSPHLILSYRRTRSKVDKDHTAGTAIISSYIPSDNNKYQLTRAEILIMNKRSKAKFGQNPEINKPFLEKPALASKRAASNSYRILQ